MHLSSSPRRATPLNVAAAAAIVVAGTIGMAVHVASVLREPGLSAGILSEGLWQSTVLSLGGRIHQGGEGEFADVPILPLAEGIALLSLLAWLAGATLISRHRQLSYSSSLCLWGRYGWLWWLLPIAWEAIDVITDISRSTSWQALCRATLPIWHSTLWAGWLTTFIILVRKPAAMPAQQKDGDSIPRVVWIAMAMYFVCFGAMNWLLYESLLLPHGDSAMYEEHIWNLLHGKGFRSYLDNGRLFLGEHVQVIHLLCIPLYLLWPSHVLLELCQSACLALGAIPVYRMARRHTHSENAAILMAIAYLLYFPMQYLDIAATLKTFRPNSFEIPLFLCALNALEQCRYRTFLAWLGLTLLCQEDAAMVIAPLGVWIALRQASWAQVTDRDARRRLVWFGSGLALFGTFYVIAVVKIVLPWFRGGADVHFAQYFDGLGTTSGEIVTNVFQHPGLLFEKWGSVKTLLFVVQLLAPLGFLPLLSPGRLAVAAPLFGVLALSAMTNSPLHHFHAPLVPILIWAALAGLGRSETCYAQFNKWRRRRRRVASTDDEHHHLQPEDFVASGKTLPTTQATAPRARGELLRSTACPRTPLIAVAVWGALCALLTVVPQSFSPLGTGFWDPYSSRFWKSLYVPGERARRFPAAFALIPLESRVASTDYIHPRFTHHARSYDYSLYRTVVPEDADYIIIDTQHPYSAIKSPHEVKEYRLHPDQWELLDDKTGGYFLVFKRK